MKHTLVTMDWMSWLRALLVFLLCWLGGFTVRRVLFHYLSRWSLKTRNQIDDIIIDSSRIHVLIWAILFGIYVAEKIAPISHATSALADKAVFSAFLLSLTLLAASIASGLIKAYSQQISLSLPLTSLTENLIRLTIIVIGILVLLAHLGVSITPLLTALGVGSLAVALALQDTLTNLFAGFYILANKQIRTGDYIRIDTGDEGYVIDIGWRATRIQLLSNNITLIPNAKLGGAIVTNYFLPEKEMSMSVPVCVAYSSDLEKVERVTIEAARETMKNVKGGIPSFEPFVRFTAFGDSAISLNVGLRVREFVDQYLITHQLIKTLHKKYAEEGIEMPFPQRVVTLKKG